MFTIPASALRNSLAFSDPSPAASTVQLPEETQRAIYDTSGDYQLSKTSKGWIVELPD